MYSSAVRTLECLAPNFEQGEVQDFDRQLWMGEKVSRLMGANAKHERVSAIWMGEPHVTGERKRNLDRPERKSRPAGTKPTNR